MEASRFVLLNNLAESLEATLVARKMYPDIPHKRGIRSTRTGV